MMYSVLIVDDEYYAREGIRKLISSWGDKFYIIGDAEDSFSALDLIQIYKPDIVLTDIHMPAMNGIELVQNALEYVTDTKFIIISGYDEFEYAKQAFKLNIVDYILKPVDGYELSLAMERAIEGILRDRNSINKSIINYLRGCVKLEELISYMNFDMYQLVLIQLEKLQEQEGIGYSEITQYIQNWVISLTGHDYYYLNMHTDRVVVLMNTSEQCLQTVADLKDDLNNRFHTSVTITLPKACKPEKLPQAYLEAKTLLSERFYRGDNKIITKILKGKQKLDISALDTVVNAIKISASAGDKKKATEKLNELYQLFYSMKCNIDIVIEQGMSLYFYVKGIFKERAIPFDSLLRYHPISFYNLTLLKLYQKNVIFLDQSMTLLRDEKSDSGDNSVKKAISIINSSYCEDLALDDLAREVFLNPSYLSRKLKETLGVSYVKYITQLRMLKAIEILRENSSIEMVASQVGYSNYRHFSDVFKQYTGYLPSQYLKMDKQVNYNRKSYIEIDTIGEEELCH